MELCVKLKHQLLEMYVEFARYQMYGSNSNNATGFSAIEATNNSNTFLFGSTLHS